MKVRIVVKEKVDLSGKVFLTGFRSNIGETGYIAVSRIVESEGARKIGFIDTEYLPPSAFMSDDGILMPYELYLLEDLVVFFSRVQPSRLEWNSLMREISSWVSKEKMREAVIIGGLDNEFQEDDGDKLRMSATKSFLKKHPDIKYRLMEGGLGMYGPLALLLTYFEMMGFPAVAILPYAERGRPDPRAAAVALEAINELYGYKLNTESLLRDAEEIEKQIELLMKHQREVGETGGKSDMFI
ncbi:MAG: proteasome assembly chaperone family protein [Candidatus Asgardarchaeia archaeon]